MRKSVLFLVAAFFIFLAIIGTEYFLNAKKPAPTIGGEGKMEVAATIFPLYAIVKEIGGAEIEAKLILPPGASPHAFEATPSLIKNLQKTSVVFFIGHGLDDWAASVAASLPRARAMVADSGIALRVSEEEKRIEIIPTEEEGEDGGEDPHYWMNPLNGIIIAQTVARTLGGIDPAHAEIYQARAADFANRVLVRDEEWKGEIAALSNKNILTFHDAYFYFADHFGLTIAGAFEPFPGKEPTPQYLAGIAAIVKEKGLREVFLEPQWSDAVVTSFANDYNLRVGVLDPEGRGYAEAKTYDDLIDYNVRTIVEVKKAP